MEKRHLLNVLKINAVRRVFFYFKKGSSKFRQFMPEKNLLQYQIT